MYISFIENVYMERDIVLPPPTLVPSLPHCVATTEFAWD